MASQLATLRMMVADLVEQNLAMSRELVGLSRRLEVVEQRTEPRPSNRAPVNPKHLEKLRIGTDRRRRLKHENSDLKEQE